jgi:hypothetical protein
MVESWIVRAKSNGRDVSRETNGVGLQLQVLICQCGQYI